MLRNIAVQHIMTRRDIGKQYMAILILEAKLNDDRDMHIYITIILTCTLR